MSLQRKSATFVPSSLLAGGFLASLVLYGVLSLPPGLLSQPANNDVALEIVTEEQTSVDAGFLMPAAKKFIGIVTRPIFSSNRRPSAEQEIAIETMATEMDARLIGVIVVSGSPIAIVEPRGSTSFVRITVGDRFQGWDVTQIDVNSVTFRRDQSVERIELSYDTPPKRPKKKKLKKPRDVRPPKATQAEQAEQAEQEDTESNPEQE